MGAVGKFIHLSAKGWRSGQGAVQALPSTQQGLPGGTYPHEACEGAKSCNFGKRCAANDELRLTLVPKGGHEET